MTVQVVLSVTPSTVTKDGTTPYTALDRGEFDILHHIYAANGALDDRITIPPRMMSTPTRTGTITASTLTTRPRRWSYRLRHDETSG